MSGATEQVLSTVSAISLVTSAPGPALRGGRRIQILFTTPAGFPARLSADSFSASALVDEDGSLSPRSCQIATVDEPLEGVFCCGLDSRLDARTKAIVLTVRAADIHQTIRQLVAVPQA